MTDLGGGFNTPSFCYKDKVLRRPVEVALHSRVFGRSTERLFIVLTKHLTAVCLIAHDRQ